MNHVSNGGTKRLTEDIQGKSGVNFSIETVPGIYGNFPVDKIRKLSARGVLVGGSEVYVTSEEAEVLATHISEILRNIGLQVGKIIQRSSPKIHSSTEQAYGNFVNAYPNRELLQEKISNVRFVELFNNKVLFTKWLEEQGFGKYIPETLYFTSIEELILYISQYEDIGERYIKSAIGASGIGTFKLSDTDQSKLRRFAEANTFQRCISHMGRLVHQLDFSGEVVVRGIDEPMPFMLQEAVSGNTELSSNYFCDHAGVYRITETQNITDNAGVHEGNRACEHPDWVRGILDRVAIYAYRSGYRGPIGFDAIVDMDSKTIAILEANPRNTGATTPAVLCERVSTLVGQTLTWNTCSPLPGEKSILHIPEFSLDIHAN